MKAIYFPGANDVMGRPEGSTPEECEDGIVHRGLDLQTNWPVFTLCFEMDDKEREEFIKNGKVFLQIYSQGMAPVGMTVYNPCEQGWVRDRIPVNPNHPALIEAKRKYDDQPKQSN